MTALLRALARPELPVRQQVVDFASQHADFAAASAALLVHAPDLQMSTCVRPLPTADASGDLAKLFIQPDSDRRLVSETMFVDAGLFVAAEDLLDLILQAPQPPRILFLLRQIPLPSLLSQPLISELKAAFLGAQVTLGRDGVPTLDPLDPRAHRLLVALAALEANEAVAGVLAAWRDLLQDGPVPPGWVEACRACEADPRPAAIDTLCKGIPGLTSAP